MRNQNLACIFPQTLNINALTHGVNLCAFPLSSPPSVDGAVVAHTVAHSS